MRRLLPLLLALSICAQTQELVVTEDGRRLYGEVEVHDDLLRVRTAQKDVYLPLALVVSRDPDGTPPAWPVYHFHQEKVAQPKAGELALIVDNGQFGPWQMDGTVPYSCKDPELGSISFTMAIARVAPDGFTVRGVEYGHRITWPLRVGGHLPTMLVEGSVDRADVAAVRKAARFFARIGDLARAESWVARAEALGAEGARDEVLAIVREEALLDLERLLFRAAWDEAERRLRPLRDAAWTHPLLDSLDAGLALRDEVAAALAARGLERRPTVPEAERAAGLLASLEGELPAALLPHLLEAWAAPFADAPWRADQLEEAAALAAEIAAFFQQDKDKGARGLGRDLERSELPFAVKCALLEHAAAFAPLEAPVRWERYEHGRRFHYYVQLPSDYTPDRAWPVLVALHGQHSTAEDVVGTWGPVCERYGVVLLAPEYIYGRKWGYKNSDEEHHSVIDAVPDAARRFHLDFDRVYLAGHSQGGHASWDIGGSHAGRYAGVMPYIGCSRDVASHDNFEDTALYVVDGSEDGLAPKFNRQSIMELARLECDATYVEFRGGKHEGFAEELDPTLRWAIRHVRDRERSQLALYAVRECDVERRWLRIAKTEDKLPERNADDVHNCWVRAEREGNTINVRGSGVRQAEVFFTPSLIDFGEKVKLRVEGRTVFHKRVEPDWELALEEAFVTRDRAELLLGKVKVKID